ncbi:hypothetical protein DSM112329_04717 [Paraconexibacter sp. AEG42_29]|uniref:Uncharacterized protein n=1 Tax=Paraconexibacter sp. AEG42_29 TaxID=2997339 RepID=A0AAU7B1E4_9ACTN
MSIDETPICRATIRGDRITLNGWDRSLAGRGPSRDGLRHVRAALADLYRSGQEDDELIVTPVGGTRWSDDAEAVLIAWATRVGFTRVWLPARVVDLAGELAACGHAQVTCPTCGARWRDESVDFWAGVRRHGWFPGRCLACGGSLPEWDVAGEGDADRARTAVPLSRRRGR